MATDAGPRRIEGIDAAFLHNETRSTPWHIVGVLVLDPSIAPGGFDTDVMRRVLAERIEHVEALRRRVIDLRGALSAPRWVVDETVDLTRHVQRASVTGLTGLAALAELAARSAQVALPRDRPLWQIEVMEDVGDGQVGVVVKVQHSVMDGVAAVGVMGALFDLVPTPPAAAVDDRATPEAEDLGLGALVRAVAHLPIAAARAMWHLPNATVGFVRALRDSGRSVTFPLSAPRTSLNRSITAAREVSLRTMPLADVREVAEAFGLTVNDVVTAMCAGALRSWLDDAGALPDRPLVAAVPVAVRDRGTHRVGNRLSVLFASLPTHLADPRERLDAVRDEMRDAKATLRDLGSHTLGALADAMPWNVIGLLFRAYSDLGLASRVPPSVNLVLSNVPGPQDAVFLGGARLTALFPLGPIFDGAALNVTIVTCGDDVDVGVVTCPDVAPGSLDSLTAHFATALDELVALARAWGETRDRPLH